jgi:uncharacterized protein YkwD
MSRLRLCLVSLIMSSLIIGRTPLFSASDSLYNIGFAEFNKLGMLDRQIPLDHPDLEFLDAAIFQATNEIRAQYGLRPFVYDEILHKAARLHTDEMIRSNFFSHTNPYSRKYRTVINRIFYEGGSWDIYSRCGENIVNDFLIRSPGNIIGFTAERRKDSLTYFYMNKNRKEQELSNCTYRELSKQVLNTWMHSKPHKRNILDPKFNVLGCACLIDPSSLNKKTKLPMVKATQDFGGRKKTKIQ